MKQIVAFTDGACKGNPGPGGWGVLLRYGDTEKTFYGSEPHTTNNRMELTAAIEALSRIKEPCEVSLFTDSQYVIKGITEWLKGWKQKGWRTSTKKPVLNEDLWRRLDELNQHHAVSWHWVRGHSGHRENELVDGLANQAIAEMRAAR